MVAYILVLDTPYYDHARTPDGEFALTGLPTRAGKLTVWHEQAEPWTMRRRAAAEGAARRSVGVVRPLIPLAPEQNGSVLFPARGRDRYNNR